MILGLKYSHLHRLNRRLAVLTELEGPDGKFDVAEWADSIRWFTNGDNQEMPLFRLSCYYN